MNLVISDLRGINNEVKLNWMGRELTFSPGIVNSTMGKSGISVPVQFDPLAPNQQFDLELNLKGSKSLMFTPVGEKTDVSVTSEWNDPGFTGNFLPVERTINDSGFSATWSVLHFNRNYPQQWTNDNDSGQEKSMEIHKSDFGVELVTMADHYQKNTRSAKYAILIILITFIVFFLYEVFSKQRIHPFQYIMVGFAITLFYLLLLSITEHLGFNVAYLISASSVLILITLYTVSFMPKFRNSLGVGLSLAACFGFVFILLQLESLALPEVAAPQRPTRVTQVQEYAGTVLCLAREFSFSENSTRPTKNPVGPNFVATCPKTWMSSV